LCEEPRGSSRGNLGRGNARMPKTRDVAKKKGKKKVETQAKPASSSSEKKRKRKRQETNSDLAPGEMKKTGKRKDLQRKNQDSARKHRHSNTNKKKKRITGTSHFDLKNTALRT